MGQIHTGYNNLLHACTNADIYSSINNIDEYHINCNVLLPWGAI